IAQAGVEVLEVIGYEAGSIRVYLKVRPDEAERLIALVEAGAFAGSRVVGCDVVTPPAGLSPGGSSRLPGLAPDGRAGEGGLASREPRPGRSSWRWWVWGIGLLACASLALNAGFVVALLLVWPRDDGTGGRGREAGDQTVRVRDAQKGEMLLSLMGQSQIFT